MSRRAEQDRPLSTFAADPPAVDTAFANVTCQDCGNEQWDLGPNTACVSCGATLPYHDLEGNLIED